MDAAPEIKLSPGANPNNFTSTTRGNNVDNEGGSTYLGCSQHNDRGSGEGLPYSPKTLTRAPFMPQTLVRCPQVLEG